MNRKRVRVVTVVAGLAVAGMALSLGASGSHAAPAPPSRPHAISAHSAARHALSVRVKGRHFVNASGKPVRLLGFNNSGAEYACLQGWGIFDVDTTTNTSVPISHVVAMAKWRGANTVRVSLNEQCWLGLAGVPSQYATSNYRKAIAAYVRQLNDHGLAVILDLHNSAPGGEASSNQEPMPDAHSVRFWHRVAETFKGNRSVVFDIFNEPFPNNQSVSTATWKCWRDGGCQQSSTNGGQTYTAIGMNQLIRAVRTAGAHNVILAGGLDYASSLAEWMRFEPTDPDHQLAASIHIYSFGGCNSPKCYNGSPAKVAKHVPLVIGEFGADLSSGMSCDASSSGTTGFDKSLFAWADRHDASMVAWTWNPWPASNGCLDLIKGFGGKPTSPYGVRVRAEFRADRQSRPV